STSTTKMTFPSPSTTVTVAPGSPVPEITGERKSVEERNAGPVITGASGAVVSTTTVTSFDSSEVFPAWSVCVATNVYSRSSNGSSGVPHQLPSSSTSTTKMTFPSPSTTVTVAPGSPVPEIT